MADNTTSANRQEWEREELAAQNQQQRRETKTADLAMADEQQNKQQLRRQRRIAQQIRKKISEDGTDKVLKKAKNKIIWELFLGLSNPVSFVPTLLILDGYAFGSYLSSFFSEELSKKIPRLDIWQLSVLALANLLSFIILLVFIVFLVFTICIVSVGTECPLSWWEIIKGAWNIIIS